MRFPWQEDQEDLQILKPTLAVLDKMSEHGPDDPDWDTYLTYLERLEGLRAAKKGRVRIDPNKVIQAAVPLAGVLIIVAVEQSHAWTSRATQLLTRT